MVVCDPNKALKRRGAFGADGAGRLLVEASEGALDAFSYFSALNPNPIQKEEFEVLYKQAQCLEGLVCAVETLYNLATTSDEPRDERLKLQEAGHKLGKLIIERIAPMR